MEFTPTQQRLLAVLADGMPHSQQELIACLGDSEATMANVHAHLAKLRPKMRPAGEDILCVVHNRQCWYRHVRLLASAYSGYS